MLCKRTEDPISYGQNQTHIVENVPDGFVGKAGPTTLLDLFGQVVDEVVIGTYEGNKLRVST